MINMKNALGKRILAAKVIGELLFLYGLLGWGYGVLMASIRPQWLPWSLSHLTPWLKLDTFTAVSFIVSAVGFLMWRLTRESSFG